jgi:hypothetical protein
MEYLPLLVVSGLLLVALVLLGLCTVFAWRSATSNVKAIEMLAGVIESQSTELRRSGDRVLAAANSVAFQSVKHFESGESQASALNNRRQVVTRI